ncbi:MAG: hypothetical protein FJ358_06775 [Thaumarchaeota archaeon]|nr:hypothetical protein [Nitrososphaerota archaeon]
MSDYYAGQDLAKRRDFTALVIIRIEEQDDSDESIARVVGVKQWPHVDYNTIIQDTEALYEKYKWENLGLDKSTVGEAVIEQYDAKYIPVEGMAFTAQSKHDMVQFLLMLLQQKRLKLPRKGAEELKIQIQEQERVYSTAGTMKYQHPENRHDDQFWALCLALHVAKDDLVGKRTYPVVVSQRDDSNLKSRRPELDRPGITIISEASNRDYLY